MIRRAVSAVYLVRDGFSGRILPPAAVRCVLDGRLCLPLWKDGGYLVLTDLSPGEHLLELLSHGFQDERVMFLAADGTVVEGDLPLKPGVGYPFQQKTTHLHLTLMKGKKNLAGEDVWLGLPGLSELKLAQEQVEAGAQEARLFCRGSLSHLPLPGAFLLLDGEASEVVRLQGVYGGKGAFSAPLIGVHSRGRLLLPAQRYNTGVDGVLEAVFHNPGTVELLAAGCCRTLELTEGENRLNLKL